MEQYGRVELLKAIPLPESAYNSTRDQYRADEVLGIVKGRKEGRILGVTGADLYVKELNFVFGLAQKRGRAAIISLNRLNGDVGKKRFHERCLKEAVHELGHTLGLDHCSDRFCVMHFSNALRDTDIKSAAFCERCNGLIKVRVPIF